MDPSLRTVYEKLRAFKCVSLSFVKYIKFLFRNVLNTDLRRLTAGLRSEKCVVR